MAVTVDTMKGIAFHKPDDCDIHEGCLIVIMIGDDAKHHVSVLDVHEVDDDEYCGGCGQIGCGW
jgi:hypothetical protein